MECHTDHDGTTPNVQERQGKGADTLAKPIGKRIAPILLNHDQTSPIGFVEIVEGALYARFTSDMKITREMAFDIFGNVGLQALEATEENGVMLIKVGRILEWSLSPTSVTPNVK
jgi:hypothetical protein